MCHNKMAASLTKTPKRRKTKSREPSWVEFLVDIILGLLSRQQLLWRYTVDKVFRQITGSLNNEAIQLIVNVQDTDRTPPYYLIWYRHWDRLVLMN